VLFTLALFTPSPNHMALATTATITPAPPTATTLFNPLTHTLTIVTHTHAWRAHLAFKRGGTGRGKCSASDACTAFLHWKN